MPELGSDEGFVESWLQFNVTHRFRTALRALHAFEVDRSAAAASCHLECFAQYPLALEDLATWATAFRSHRDSGGSLITAVDRAAGIWDPLMERLVDGDPLVFADAFALPHPDVLVEPGRTAYHAKLRAWATPAASLARNVLSEEPGGGRRLLRLSAKVKHGLLLHAGVEGSRTSIYFLPSTNDNGPQRELPLLKATTESIEFWVRGVFDVSRLTNAVLRTWFVTKHSRDPVAAWTPPETASNNMTITQMEETLGTSLPAVVWNDAGQR